jgi:hypothetical protein
MLCTGFWMSRVAPATAACPLGAVKRVDPSVLIQYGGLPNSPW